MRRPLSRSADPAALLLLCKPFSQRFHPLSGYSLSRGQGPQNFSTTSHHKMNLTLDFYLNLCYIRHILAHSGRVLEPYLNTERGVASCGGGSQPLSREVRDPASRALRPGRKELAATEPNLPKRKREAGSGERSAAPGAQNRHGESAERRASRVMGRKAPRKRLACAPMRTPHGCLASTRTSLGAPPPLDRGDAKRQNKTRAQKTRRGNGTCCLKSE